jgi:hypothetical protein
MGFKQFVRRRIMGNSIFRRIEAIEQRLGLDEVRNFAPYCYLGQGVGVVRLRDGHSLYVTADDVPVVGTLLKCGRWSLPAAAELASLSHCDTLLSRRSCEEFEAAPVRSRADPCYGDTVNYSLRIWSARASSAVTILRFQ